MNKTIKPSTQWLNRKKIKEFWERRVSYYPVANPELVNLEDNPALLSLKEKEETAALFEFLQIDKKMSLLDLGAGYGQWSLLLAPSLFNVVAVDFIEAMLEKGREKAAFSGIDNIEFINCEAEKFNSDKQWDRVLISGLLMYMNDDQAEGVAEVATKVCKLGGRIILREATSILEGRYGFRDRWSSKLNSFYSAIYRTPAELKDLFVSKGCTILEDRDLYSPNSPLNKWPETRMRIYSFRK